MIFGFNTDVKYGDTVYHVQSEARQADLLLQSQVFVRGRCIGKKATSYASLVAAPDYSENQMHDMLKAQHKSMVDAIRAGNVDKLFSSEPEVEDAGGHGLGLSWTNADAIYADSNVVMRFHVTDGGAGVEGAKLISRLSLSAQDPIYAQAVTDAQGTAEMKLVLDEAQLHEAAILVQASHGDKTATRKFRLRKHE